MGKKAKIIICPECETIFLGMDEKSILKEFYKHIEECENDK